MVQSECSEKGASEESQFLAVIHSIYYAFIDMLNSLNFYLSKCFVLMTLLIRLREYITN